MIPFYFGASDRQLFGAYHPASRRSKRGVVLCNPWGQEYLRAHQSLRFLASLAADQDLHTFRFDYYGTGDSGGPSYVGDDPRSWTRDLSEAVEELKDTSGVRTVSLVGLRLGAVPAIEVALQRNDIEKVVLWDPVLEGLAFLEELLAPASPLPTLHTASDGFPMEGGVVETMGFLLTPKGREGIQTVLPSLIRAGLPPVLLLSTIPESKRYAEVERALAAANVEWTSETVPGPEAWVEEENFGTSGMPVSAIRRITEWLA